MCCKLVRKGTGAKIFAEYGTAEWSEHYSLSVAAVHLAVCVSVYPSICLSIYGTINMGDGVDCSRPFNLLLGRKSKGADRRQCLKFKGRRARFVTGWPRSTGWLIFEVIFHTRAQSWVATLQKETWHKWHAMRFCQYAEYIWVSCWKLDLSQVCW